MSRRLGAQDTTAGGLLKVPPSDSQPPQKVASDDQLWNMSLATPRPKMSRRLGAHDTAAGGLLKARRAIAKGFVSVASWCHPTTCGTWYFSAGCRGYRRRRRRKYRGGWEPRTPPREDC